MTLLDEWRSYRGEVLPRNAPAVQVRETRRAFYAGAAAWFGLMLRAADQPGDEPTEVELSRVDALNAELEAFGKAIGTPAEDSWDAGPS